MRAEDQFRDKMMTFGEHLEELRIHLLRAVYGLLVAVVVLMYFGNYVVKILAEPVESQLKVWFETQTAKRSRQFQENESHRPASEQLLVRFPLTLPADEMAKVAERLGIQPPDVDAGPLTLQAEAPAGDLIRDLSQPLNDVNRRWALKSLSAQEAFVIYFKAVLGASLVVASPWIFFQLYSFIAVGLYAHERRLVNLAVPFSVTLFLAGVLVCYFLVFPRMLSFFLWTNEWMEIEPDIRLNEWVGFCVVLMLIFGIGFQLPMLMLLLERVGILTHSWMAKQRKIAVLALAVIAAVVTPGGDPITMVFLAVPLYALFELGLFLMRYFQRQSALTTNDRALAELDAEI